MAKIRIQISGKAPVWIQCDNEESIKEFLTKCGYSQEESDALVQWALSRHFGAYHGLPSAEVHKENGNVETWDNRTGEWISSPPEMEAFLADIRTVCKKHGLSLRADNNGDVSPFLVQAYQEYDNMSLIDAAAKDYTFDEIRKQPAEQKPAMRWEYQSIFLSIHERETPAPDDLNSAAFKIFPNGRKGPTPWWQTELEAILNEYGSYGWEVVTISDALLRGEEEEGYLVLKRPIAE